MKKTIVIALGASIFLASCGNQTSDNNSSNNSDSIVNMPIDTTLKGTGGAMETTPPASGSLGAPNAGNTAIGTSNASGNDTAPIGTNRTVGKDSIDMRGTGSTRMSTPKPAHDKSTDSVKVKKG